MFLMYQVIGFVTKGIGGGPKKGIVPLVPRDAMVNMEVFLTDNLESEPFQRLVWEEKELDLIPKEPLKKVSGVGRAPHPAPPANRPPPAAPRAPPPPPPPPRPRRA